VHDIIIPINKRDNPENVFISVWFLNFRCEGRKDFILADMRGLKTQISAEQPKLSRHQRKSAKQISVNQREKKLTFLILVGALLIVFAATSARCHQQENSEEHKAVCKIEIIVEIGYTQEWTSGKKSDNSAQEQQTAGQSDCPTEVIQNRVQFHKSLFW
jgi:hypothetical protein